MSYKKFRIRECMQGAYRVEVKCFLGFYMDGYISTDYFKISYTSKNDALKAIEGYKNRFTEVL